MKNLNLKQRLVTITVFLIVCGIGGLLVMVSGIMPIKASSGHWDTTKWVLNFSKSRSVATHSLGIETPPLDDPALIMKGAGHYETGCVQCHGSPSRPASPIALGMTATPPSLPPKIARRKPRELFYIVKHGIKLTGMPAWPAQQRDDEVWAVVAFLMQLPEMNADRYRELTTVPQKEATTEPPDELSAAIWDSCRRCHGNEGNGRETSAFPKLAGQNREYLFATLKAYASGRRHSGMMQPVAAVLSKDDLAALADAFSTMSAGKISENAGTPAATSTDEDQERLARGRTIAKQGIPARKIPSCMDCHGLTKPPLMPKYPALRGQHARYIELQLQLFQSGHRGGTSAAHLMLPVVERMTEEEMQDVAAFYASLSAE